MRHPSSIPVLLSVATATALAQTHELAVAPLSAIGVCSREGVKLDGAAAARGHNVNVTVADTLSR